MDDVADFIVADCDKAAELLPTVYKDAKCGRCNQRGGPCLKRPSIAFYKKQVPDLVLPLRENGRQQQMQTKQSSI